MSKLLKIGGLTNVTNLSVNNLRKAIREIVEEEIKVSKSFINKLNFF